MNLKRFSILSTFTTGVIIGLLVSMNLISSIDLIAKVASGNKIIVFYFHNQERNYTCVQFERLTKKAVTDAFKKELDESKIEFRVVNFDLPENRHFINEYKLVKKSVIVSDMNGSNVIRWKNLQRIWDKYSDEAPFLKYIRDEVREYL